MAATDQGDSAPDRERFTRWLQSTVNVLLILAALYNFATKELGLALALLLIACLNAVILWGRSLKELREALRDFFYNADRLARYIVIAIAVPGSAIIVDQVYFNIDFIPWQLIDPWVKRLFLIFVVTAPMLFVTSLISKACYEISKLSNDSEMLVYEVPFYIATVLFLTANAIFMIGYPFEKWFVDPNRQPPNLIMPPWPGDLPNVFGATTLVFLLWCACFGVCILSRRVEWFAKKAAAGNPMSDPRGAWAPGNSEQVARMERSANSH